MRGKRVSEEQPAAGRGMICAGLGRLESAPGRRGRGWCQAQLLPASDNGTVPPMDNENRNQGPAEPAGPHAHAPPQFGTLSQSAFGYFFSR